MFCDICFEGLRNRPYHSSFLQFRHLPHSHWLLTVSPVLFRLPFSGLRSPLFMFARASLSWSPAIKLGQRHADRNCSSSSWSNKPREAQNQVPGILVADILFTTEDISMINYVSSSSSSPRMSLRAQVAQETTQRTDGAEPWLYQLSRELRSRSQTSDGNTSFLKGHNLCKWR